MRSIRSFSELLDAYQTYEDGQIDPETFDDIVSYILSFHIGDIADLEAAPKPVALYYAARTLEFEVGNGGFPQAAYNCPDWFNLAAQGYQTFGLTAAADLITQAEKLLPNARKKFSAFNIGNLFTQFRKSKLAALDAKLDSVDWWALDARIAYLIDHRDLFLNTGMTAPTNPT